MEARVSVGATQLVEPTLTPSLDIDVAIAGAGVIGASTAWHLATSGLTVALIDAEGPAAAASGASDGAVSVASKKPGPMARLASASLMHTAKLAEYGPLSRAFSHRPSFLFAQGAEEVAALDALATKLSQIGGPVRVERDGGPALLPGCDAGIDRIVHLAGEGHMPGHKAVHGYLTAAGDRLRCLWPSPLKKYEADDTGVTLDLGRTRLRARFLVVAIGLGAKGLLPELPLVPRAGQLIVTDHGPAGALPGALTAAAYLLAKTLDGAPPPRPPVVIDPLATGQYLVGSTREAHGDPALNDFATVAALMHRAATVWPELHRRRIIRIFTGVRAAVSDGLPIFGTLPDSPRVLLATGFEGDGICLSALIGREAARIARGEGVTAGLEADLGALSPARFILNKERGVA